MNLSTERVEHAILARLSGLSETVREASTRCDGCGRLVATRRTETVKAAAYCPECVTYIVFNTHKVPGHQQYALRTPGEDEFSGDDGRDD
jgi:uncharacterized paraquat-inducible protein A